LEDRIRILDPEEGSEIQAGWTDPGESKEVVFRVRLEGSEAAPATVRLLSTRGGVHEAAVQIEP
jgi:hypothetical protein